MVRVYITDKKGNPVTDLEKSDFILYDNGKLKTVTDFEKHFLIKPEKKVEEEIAKTELPPAEDVASKMSRKFFLLLDIDRNSSAGISKSKKAALHFIDTQLQPTDEVGVFSYSFIRFLVLHQYLTSDHEKARVAIKKIKEVPGEGGGGGVIVARGGGSGTTPFTQPSFQMMDDVDRTNVFIKTIKELAKALRHIQGYKNIILFSRGIGSGLLFSPNQVLRENFEDMSKEFATSNSPVHTVSTALKSSGESSLKMLSELSGGKYFPNVDYYEQIADQIQDVTSNYYVLGYYIDEKWDGKFHKIKVEVKRKGCKVYVQGGFFNP
ncbi:MAG: VWA domain-containing protein, partial [Promethearchaeota archaeon]